MSTFYVNSESHILAVGSTLDDHTVFVRSLPALRARTSLLGNV